MFVYLPPSYARDTRACYPVVVFLHGYTATAEAYVRYLELPQSADNAIAAGAREMIIVLPDAFTAYSGSMYSSSVTTGDWESYIADDLIAYVDSHYRTLARRDSRGLGGHSMGGYGAFKLALSLPEQFAAAASLSGVADVGEFRRERAADFQLVFGDSGPARGSEHDLFHLASRLASSAGPRPRLYQCCGTEDFLIAQNRALSAHLKPLGLDYVYEEAPGIHDWAYWDEAIERALSWLGAA